MPNYPKFDPAKSAELARKLKEKFSINALFGENSESGTRVKNLASDGNWLEKAIEYFDIPYQKGMDENLWDKIVGIYESLCILRNCINGLDDFMDPNNLPEDAEARWNGTMEALGGTLELNKDIMAYNEITKNEHIGDPEMQVALGMGRWLTGANGMLEHAERIRRFDAAREFSANYPGMKENINNQLNNHLEICNKFSVDANDIIHQRIKPVGFVELMGKYHEKYDELAQKYDSEYEKEVKDSAAITDPLEVDILLLKNHIAFLEYKKARIAFENQRDAAKKIGSELNYVMADYPDDVTFEDIKANYEKTKHLENMINDETIDKDTLIDAYLKSEDGYFWWNGRYYEPNEDEDVYEEAVNELKKADINTIKETIADHFVNDIQLPYLNYPHELKQQLQEANQKTAELQKIYDDRLKQREEFVEQFKNHPYVKSHGNKDEWRKTISFKFSSKTVDNDIQKLQIQLAEKQMELVDKYPSLPINQPIHKSRKIISDNIKTMSESLKKQEDVIQKTFVDPLSEVYENGKTLKADVNNLNQKTADIKQEVNAISDFNPEMDARYKMRDFVDLLEKNRRTLHRDGKEFKALKTLVEDYSKGKEGVTLDNIKDACKTYLDAKEGQVVSANSNMRNYRKAIVGMISEYCGTATQDIKDYNEHMQEFIKSSAEINKIPEKDVKFREFFEANQEEPKKLYKEFDEKLMPYANALNTPLGHTEVQIVQFEKMADRVHWHMDPAMDVNEETIEAQTRSQEKKIEIEFRV